MHLTAQLKLLPSAAQADALSRTLIAFNAACDYISKIAWESKTFRQFDLHKLCYREARQRFGLTAQAAVRAISKVADAYKLDKRVQRGFKPSGAAAYDSRILSYSESCVSIWSLDGRLNIPFTCGNRQRILLGTQKGESDLAFVRGQWYLLATCVVPDAEQAGGPAMGVDLGIRNTAATSNGTLKSGADRQRFKETRNKVRASLQSRNNRRARRALRRQAGRERRRISWENHNLSKSIVAEAEGTQCGTIRMERLAGIRQRCKIFNKHTSRMMSGWSFGQLQVFVAYKAERRGIKIEYVEPAYTSQICSKCGVLGIRRGDVFSCTTCGKSHADVNAAVNIARGGVALGAKHRARKPARMTAGCKSVSHIVKSRCL
jgi:putative transposase